ncbi:3-dehydroquinate synthase [Corynebacterium aquilae]|uniref:3-dehydroquinate synthase n=1 Tax=Corynebacterium aquilae DSM 44791 TaxID=1431546 RepID=A0A1L7CG53_9CORY|nr:3-dehydroquinate synthase [Corynebacterium aquilae]APT84850.1 3-dehydroquinate synthase [Corynebacterium aquilae DSM 44791]
MASVTVASQAPYEVHIDSGLDGRIADFVAGLDGCHTVGVVFQPSLDPAGLVSALQSRGLRVVPMPIPDAEEGKSLATCGHLWDVMGGEGFTRRDCVIGFGGGAATDLAGFVAAGWMRGIKVVQVPTTLLAMVDAAVGGKTGINTAAGKNLVGAFHEPAAVFIDLDRIATLPRSELVAGSAEIIKTGFISDTVILDRYEADPEACLRVDGFLPELIERSVSVKARVVASDLKESGLREILNYGHTFGHAVELNEHFEWRHGNAVAVGMMFIANLAQIEGLIDEDLVVRHERILASIGLPTKYRAGVFEQLLTGMTRDKKNRDGMIRFVALTAAGQPTRLEGPSRESLEKAYARISA